MKIYTFTTGPFQTNSYLIIESDARQGLLIDAGSGLENKIKTKLAEEKSELLYLLNTHGHWDHIADNALIQQATGCKIGIHSADAIRLRDPSVSELSTQFKLKPTDPTIDLQDGLVLSFGSVKFQVIHTPGHTPGGVCFFFPNQKILFSGDTLFAGSIGRTDFPGGDYDTIIRSIKEKILILPDDVQVYPGHGPSTTIGYERSRNPFLITQ